MRDSPVQSLRIQVFPVDIQKRNGDPVDGYVGRLEPVDSPFPADQPGWGAD